MKKTNRLIENFKKQSKNTIIKYMNDLTKMNYSVYSTYRWGLYPHLNDYEVYFYADSATVVLVCLDCCGNNDKQTYDESEEMGSFIYRANDEPRVSVVWKLSEAIKQITRYLQPRNEEITVFGILLTEATILNAGEMEERWESRNIKVIDGCKRLKSKLIWTNRDEELVGKANVDAVYDAALKERLKAETVEDRKEDGKEKVSFEENEFEKMLTDFINREYEETFGNEGSNDEAEADEEEDETDSPVGDDEDEDDDDPVYYPDGTVEQNNNMQVTVEILRPVANPREELDKLVGCDDIKHRMDELVALTSYNKRMHELFPEIKPHAVSLHSLFLGRPGTGKTTVCRLFGSLMHQAGALSKGHVVICDRGTFMGTLWGDEERSLRQVLEKAQGGVLMLDEAYLLNSPHPHDPGKIVIQLLMKVLADESQRDIAVVLCGYKEPMMKMLDLNQGLASRLPNRFEFKDFTVEELMEITRRRLKDYGYSFTPSAWEKYRDMLSLAYQSRDPETWGNARFIANQLERIYIQHATRCVNQQPMDKAEMLMLTAEDIVPIEVPQPKPPIGFVISKK